MNLIEFIGQYDTDIKLDTSRSKGNDSNIHYYINNSSIHYYINIRDTINNYSCEIKSGGCLQGFSGRGTTLLNALNDLSEEIRNTTIVANAMGKNRKEFKVPDLKRMYCVEDIFEDLLRIHNLRYDMLKELNK